MPNKYEKNNLFLYISISIVLHLLLLYFLPIGFLQGSVQSEGELNDYGYVQMVNYQPSPVQVTEPEPEAEVEEVVEEEAEQTVEEEPEPTPEETDVEEEAVEEQVVERPEEDTVENNETEVTEEEQAAQTEEDTAETEVVVEEENQTAENTSEADNTENTQEAAQDEQENIMSSEESESQIEVEQQAANTEESSGSDSESEQEQQNTESAEEAAEVKEETPPPPPPPTSGDLINLVVTPAFPKDLVGTRSEGQVRLTAVISRQGTVQDVSVEQSSGFDSMDRVAVMTIERGWTFKEYQQPYRIPVQVNYYIDEADNTQVEVELGEVQFISGGE